MEEKITKKDFKHYQKCVKKYVKKFGIGGWEIIFDCRFIEGIYASTNWNTQARSIMFTLSNVWEEFDEKKSDKSLDRLAFHEVCHLVLARLHTLASARFISEVQITEASHEIIQMLDHFNFPNLNIIAHEELKGI